MLKTIQHYLHANRYDKLLKNKINRACMEHSSVDSNWGMKFLTDFSMGFEFFLAKKKGYKTFELFLKSNPPRYPEL